MLQLQQERPFREAVSVPIRKCAKCNRLGHLADDCRSSNESSAMANAIRRDSAIIAQAVKSTMEALDAKKAKKKGEKVHAMFYRKLYFSSAEQNYFRSVV